MKLTNITKYESTRLDTLISNYLHLSRKHLLAINLEVMDTRFSPRQEKSVNNLIRFLDETKSELESWVIKSNENNGKYENNDEN